MENVVRIIATRMAKAFRTMNDTHKCSAFTEYMTCKTLLNEILDNKINYEIKVVQDKYVLCHLGEMFLMMETGKREELYDVDMVIEFEEK